MSDIFISVQASVDGVTETWTGTYSVVVKLTLILQLSGWKNVTFYAEPEDENLKLLASPMKANSFGFAKRMYLKWTQLKFQLLYKLLGKKEDENEMLNHST